MSRTPEGDFHRYLESKVTVDDRALNPRVWNAFADAVAGIEARRPPVVMEPGGGIGTMLERFLDHGMFTSARYTLVDSDAEAVRTARSRLERRRSTILHAGRFPEVEYVGADALKTVENMRSRAQAVDAVVGHAFLDLTDVRDSVPRFLSVLSPGGLFYFTLNYDGVTHFWPQLDPVEDPKIEALYTQTMRRKTPNGSLTSGGRSGRELFGVLAAEGARITEAGSSDWVVYPRDCRYPGDEAYFLHYILGFVEEALTGHEELDPGLFREWLSRRRRQIDAGELVYVAHQLDFTGTLG
ncbi:MAG: class I SAM-dependent methyltransferase [Spirochaetaceae bacterium]